MAKSKTKFGIKTKLKSKSNDSGQKSNDNFTAEETESLVKEVVARKETIQDPISAILTHSMKMTAWSNSG